MKNTKSLVVLVALCAAASSQAESVDYMLNECANVGHEYYGDFDARTEMKYNGQRTDGTHAVNGEIFLENRAGYFACSFDRQGRQMTTFFADGNPQNGFLPGRSDGSDDSGRSDHAQDSGYFTVVGVPGNDVLNVRSGASANRDIGDRVRDLGCRNEGRGNWCRIQMLDDMRSEGWVNARYLSRGQSTSAEAGGQHHGSSIRDNCARAVAREVGVSPDDVMVTNTTVSEGTGRTVVYVGVPYGKADWICEADRDGTVVNVFYSGE